MTEIRNLPLEIKELIVNELSVEDLLNINELPELQDAVVNMLKRRVHPPAGVDAITYTKFLLRAPLHVILYKLQDRRAKKHERISPLDIAEFWPFLRGQTIDELTGLWNKDKIRDLGYDVDDYRSRGMRASSINSYNNEDDEFINLYIETYVTDDNIIDPPDISITDDTNEYYVKNASYLHLLDIN